MSYYFPINATAAASIQNISHSILATTAETPFSVDITAVTASYATSVQNAPPSGNPGTNKTVELCGSSTIKGDKGLQGDTGSKGADNTSCPPGTIECAGLFTSLSMALPGFPNGINFIRPSGSKFSKVCMEIPAGCTSVTAVCPPFLPTASITTTYPNIS